MLQASSGKMWAMGRGVSPLLTGDGRGTHGLQSGANANVKDQGLSEARPFRGMAAVSSHPPLVCEL